MTRTRDEDACPGALTVHHAADGALVRVRLPGGMIASDQLEALAHAAAGFGSGTLELTSRGNVQLRGLTATDAVAEIIANAGLLPSATHERVRNIVASPLSGRVGGRGDVRGWTTELDTAIQAEPELAALPGRFWFGIDDGRGDVSGLGADVGAHLLEDSVALLLAGRDTGVRLDTETAVPTMVSVAKRFADIREKAWRIAELADTTALLENLPVSAVPGGPWPPVTRAPVGWIRQDDGRVTLGAAVPLGVLSARVAEYLAAIERAAGDHTMALGAGLRPRRGRCRRRPAGAGADGPGVRRELAVALRQRVHRQPRLRALRRRCPRGRGAGRGHGERAPIGISSAASGPAAAHRPVRCWSRRETDTGCAASTRRVSGVLDYIRDAAEIYRQSFATIRAEADLSRFPDDVARVVVRLIHTCGQVDVAEHVAFSDDVVAKTHAALAAGAPVLCDSSMVAAGITRSRLPADNEVVSLVADDRAADLAARLGTHPLGGRGGSVGRPSRRRGARHRQRADRVVPAAGTRRRRRPDAGRGAGRAGRVRRVRAVQAGADRPAPRHVLPGGDGSSRRQRDGRRRRQRDRQ